MKNTLAILFGLLLSHSQSWAAPTEIWGGNHLQLEVIGDSARFMFDCASAEVAEGWMVRHGRIDAEGFYTPSSGVRPMPGHEPKTETARFAAVISGSKMKVKIETKSGISTYRLVRGQQGVIHRCM